VGGEHSQTERDLRKTTIRERRLIEEKLVVGISLWLPKRRKRDALGNIMRLWENDGMLRGGLRTKPSFQMGTWVWTEFKRPNRKSPKGGKIRDGSPCSWTRPGRGESTKKPWNPGYRPKRS